MARAGKRASNGIPFILTPSLMLLLLLMLPSRGLLLVRETMNHTINSITGITLSMIHETKFSKLSSRHLALSLIARCLRHDHTTTTTTASTQLSISRATASLALSATEAQEGQSERRKAKCSRCCSHTSLVSLSLSRKWTRIDWSS